MSGSVLTRRPLMRTPAETLVATGLALGLDGGSWIDARRYRDTDALCRNPGDPTEGGGVCDDQSIVVGYAGYDASTRFLPPEKFLAHALGEVLWGSCRRGPLMGAGPDGKLLVRLREPCSSGWIRGTGHGRPLLGPEASVEPR